MNKLDIVDRYKAKENNAAKRNLQFDMSFSTFENIVNQSKCAYSGEQFNDTDILFSFERIDNNIGYVDGNVIPVRRDWNTARNQHDSKSIRISINDISSKIVNVKKQIEFLRERLAKNQALNDSPTELVEKVRISKKHHTTWLKLFNDADKKSKSVDNLRRELDRLKTMNVRMASNATKTKREKLQSRICNNLKNRSASKKNAVKKYENFMYQTKCERVIGKIPVGTNKSELYVSIAEDKRFIKKLTLDLKKYENYIEVYSNLAVQLDKFENLNILEKTKIKFGLPLDYPVYKLIKYTLRLKMEKLWKTVLC